MKKNIYIIMLICLIIIIPYVIFATLITSDINRDGIVDGNDLVRLGISFGKTSKSTDYDSTSDISKNDQIDGNDLISLGREFGLINEPPSISNVSAYQQDSVVVIGYDFFDSEQVNITYKYLSTSVWETVITPSASAPINGKNTFSWNAKLDCPNIYESIKIKIDVKEVWATTNSATDESGYFPLDTKAPDDIQCVTPSNNSTEVGLLPILITSQGNDNSKPIYYQFQLSTDSNFSKIETTSAYNTDNSYSLVKRDNSKDYWWRVRAKDKFGNESNYSTASKFRTKDNTKPNIPTPIYPLNNAQGISLYPTLIWSGGDSSDVEDSIYYKIFLYYNTTGQPAIPDTVYTVYNDTMYTLSTQLKYGSTYYWKIEANDYKTTNVSPFWNFKTIPSATVNLAPTISSVYVSQKETTGVVEISYTLYDSTQNNINIDFEYWYNTTWNSCNTTTGEGNQTTGIGKIGTWTAKSDLHDFYGTTSIKIKANDYQTLNYSTDFTISYVTVDTKIPYIKVKAPNGGEYLKGDSTYIIQWEASDSSDFASDAISIYYTTTGITYETLLTTQVNDSSYTWSNIPKITSSEVRVKIKAKDKYGNESLDTSDSTFTIDSQAPRISSTNPINDATNVSVRTYPSVTFNEKMDIATFDSSTFKINNGAIQGNVFYQDSTVTATFYPSAGARLPYYNTTYTATITNGVKDKAGNQLSSDSTWSFTTQNDTTSPTFTGVKSAKVITFDSIILNWDMANDNLTPWDQIGYIVYYNTVSNNVFQTTSTYETVYGKSSDLVKGLKSDTVYYFGVRSIDENNKYDTNQVIKSPVYPPNETTGIGIPVNTSITVFYGEDIQQSTLDTTSFVLKKKSDQSNVAGIVKYGTFGSKIGHFIPSAYLDTNTVYEVTLTSDLKLTSGPSIAPTGCKWSFKTSSSQPSSTQELELGVALFDTTLTKTGDFKYYKVYVGKDENLVVILNSESTDDDNELYIRYNALPSREVYDDKFDLPGNPDQSVGIFNTQAGYYYIYVYNSFHSNDSDKYTITAYLSSSYPGLTKGIPIKNSLNTVGDTHYYQVYMESGKNLIAILNSESTDDDNELYIRYNALPSREIYDDKFDLPGNPDQSVGIFNTQAGYYYIMVYQSYHSSDSDDYTISIDY